MGEDVADTRGYSGAFKICTSGTTKAQGKRYDHTGCEPDRPHTWCEFFPIWTPPLLLINY